MRSLRCWRLLLDHGAHPGLAMQESSSQRPQPRRADILNSILNPGDARGMVSDDHQQHIGSDLPEIAGVACDDGLLRPPRTNDDVGINYVGCSGSSQ